jgi:serine protease Do
VHTQLLHLSGPLRGRTVTYPKDRVLIGSGSEADVALPGNPRVSERHAEIAFHKDECTFHLRRLDGQVFVNHQEVEEVILEPEDLVEFGVGGPMARFRIHMMPGSFCKPVHQMLGDARDVGKKSGVLASLGGLVRDLLFHATLTLKIGGIVFGIVFVAAVVGLASFLGGRLGSDSPTRREQLIQLQKRIQEIQEHSSSKVEKTEVDALRAQLKKSSAVVDQLVEANQALGRVLEEYSRGVCLVHGIFGFLTVTGDKEELLKDKAGEPLTVEYTGSGFLASADGWIVTNHHVAEPWWHSDEVRPLIELGLKPRFVSLQVSFPRHEPIPVDLATIKLRADAIDVAVMRAAVKDVPILPLFEGDPRTLRGQRVVVLGYPTGINAVLAKADPEVAEEVTSKAKDLTGMIAELARRGMISPVATQGALNDVQDRKLVYDASTTSGGSGGPVFGPGGTVVGVNFAILREFGGSNFGVPIRFAKELLP